MSSRLKSLSQALLLTAGLTFAVGQSVTFAASGAITGGSLGGESGSGSAGLSGASGSSSSATTGGTSGEDPATDAAGKLTCEGKQFDPASDPDWNNLYPMSWGGSKIGSGAQPPWMQMPATCSCNSHFWSINMPGLGFTYWEPLAVAEIQREPGCMSTWGGTQVLKGYGKLKANGNESRDDGEHFNRMQVHEYTYPVLAVIGLFEDFVCLNPAAFMVTGMTEFNPIWNMGGSWNSAMDPRSILTATPPAQAACGIEASLLYAGGWHLNFMDWCIGGWGASSVLGGDINVTNSTWHSNGLTYFKYRQMQAAFGNVWTTIGPGARCNSFPFPIMDKAQVRYNQIYPWPLKGKPIRMGDLPVGVSPVTTNSPTKDSTGALIWEGKQCCLRF